MKVDGNETATDGTMGRREFLGAAAFLGGGLVVGFHLRSFEAEAASRQAAGSLSQTSGASVDASKAFVPNAWIRVTPDDRVAFVLDRVEMGQGTITSHAMMVAEEMELEPASLEVLFAEGVGGDYRNPALNIQLTGGSTSVATSWVTLRTAAATARETLKAAAAKAWGVPAGEILAREGTLSHERSGKKGRYGEFASAAAAASVPAPKVELKKPSEFRVLGKPVPRLDLRSKVAATARYGIDVAVPGALSAYVVRPPTIGGSPKSFKSDQAKKQPGVRHVVGLPTGVAVVADHWYQAKRAAELVEVEWDEGPLAKVSTEALRAEFAQAAKAKGGKKARSEGNVTNGFATAAKIVEAIYEAPFLAHATMEPQNATAHVTEKSCEVWAPTQGPQQARMVAARVTGLSHDAIRIHQTFLGGGFGRRINQDYVEEAVRLSAAIKAPVKVVWSREDDTRTDFYRPCATNWLRAALDATGNVLAWESRVVTPSIIRRIAPEFVATMSPGWMPRGVKSFAGNSASKVFGLMVDDTAVEGAATLRYDLPNLRVEYVHRDPGVPVGFWRSVGHSFNAFFTEGFIDELAHAAAKDPYEFRRALLGKHPRLKGVLELAAQKADWGKPLPPGVFRGIAVHESFKSYAAQVAEVSVEGTLIKVRRVVCAVDCGFVVNPDIVASQVESGIVFGLSAALKQRIDIEAGRVKQGNFHEFEVVRLNECPAIEVHVVQSGEEPTGIGEPPVPPVAPAVANAVFAATGKRLRSLPLTLG